MKDFIEVNSDLHIHGLYAMAVSHQMKPEVIGPQAKLKGIQLMATGDILHNKWLSLVKEQLKYDESSGLLEHKDSGTKFILQTEIADSHRIHHIVLFPSISKVEELREALKPKHICSDIDADGRPQIKIGPEQLAELCINADCLIGPAHAFTPYFGIYAHYNSYKQAYGTYHDKIHFTELGLSADTNMADRIKELHNLTFLSNSDAHSPYPNKLGREFNTLRLKDISFSEIKKALQRKDDRKCILNVGFKPVEGKYHKTRCRGCLTFYTPKEAQDLRWRCPNCKNIIKKGVDFRIEELSSYPEGKHPDHRPELDKDSVASLNIKYVLKVWANSLRSNVVVEDLEAYASRVRELIDVDGLFKVVATARYDSPSKAEV